MPVDTKTDAAFVERLRAAAKRGLSVNEVREQRVSFVYGNLPKGSPMTRHQVKEALERSEGATA